MKTHTGLAALLATALAACPEHISYSVTYQGVIPELGHTTLAVIQREYAKPMLAVHIEADSLSRPEYPFQQHQLFDDDNDGVFDVGLIPQRPGQYSNRTVPSMRRYVDRKNSPAEFYRLERAVRIALSAARKKQLKIIRKGRKSNY